MKKLSELQNDDLLVVTPKGRDGCVMDKREFLESYYYLDKEDVKVTIADEQYATFDLEDALESLEDDMHEEWLGNVMDAIPKEVRENLETEINSYLQKYPTYHPGEVVDWEN